MEYEQHDEIDMEAKILHGLEEDELDAEEAAEIGFMRGYLSTGEI